MAFPCAFCRTRCEEPMPPASFLGNLSRLSLPQTRLTDEVLASSFLGQTQGYITATLLVPLCLSPPLHSFFLFPFLASTSLGGNLPLPTANPPAMICLLWFPGGPCYLPASWPHRPFPSLFTACPLPSPRTSSSRLSHRSTSPILKHFA